MFLKEAYTYRYMNIKRYVPIIIGVVALCAVLYIGNNQMNKNDIDKDEQVATTTALTSFTGKVTKIFEGENTLEYGFDIPETATATVEKDGSLVKVTDSSSDVLAVYFSYEGGRGYSPSDYITNNIVPHVQVITAQGTTTIGSHEWTVVDSEWSVWHIAPSSNGQWLIVVENKKTENGIVIPILESFSTK